MLLFISYFFIAWKMWENESEMMHDVSIIENVNTLNIKEEYKGVFKRMLGFVCYKTFVQR
jgi:hypothetical protein